MSDEQTAAPGTIGWIDLTVDNAETIRDFYTKVVGWKSDAVDMGGYSDFTMTPPETGQPTGGICHARGTNTGLPAQWLIYITVKNLEQSMKACKEAGGEIVKGPSGSESTGRSCVIRDPSGAATVIFEPAGS